MQTKNFHFLLQCGCLYKNVKVLTEHGYANTCAEIYWILKTKGYVYILPENKKDPKKINIDEVYKFCSSDQYNIHAITE